MASGRMIAIPSKVDENQGEIVKALRAAGCSVQDLHELGQGCPDLLVGYHGVNYLIEVKTPGNRLNSRELGWFSAWRGPASIAWTAEDALRIVGVEVEDE